MSASIRAVDNRGLGDFVEDHSGSARSFDVELRIEDAILQLVGRGLTNPEIVARLFLSVRTVESHVAALLRKLDLSGRPALITLAAREPTP